MTSLEAKGRKRKSPERREMPCCSSLQRLLSPCSFSFQNELSLAPKINGSDHIISLLGFCSDHRRCRRLLVYELMPNCSLQDALIDQKCPELAIWTWRLSITLDIARGLEFLKKNP